MLTQEQLAQYRLDGYVLVSGLISEETIANAEAAMWFTLGMNRDDPTSWSPFPEETDELTTNVNLGLIEHFGLQTPALLACCTPAFYEVQDQLARRIQVRFTVRIHSQKQSGHEVSFRFRVTGIISMGTLTVDIDLSMSFLDHSVFPP